MGEAVGYLVVGVILAGVGGEVFVRGTVGLALAFRIPVAVVGVTVAAFATSSPELSVAISAGAKGTPEVSIGDALGSNVVNIGLILGLALLLGPVKAGWKELSRDFGFALGAPALSAFLLGDGTLSRLDGAVLLALFIVWLWLTVREARQARGVTPPSSGEAPSRGVLALQLLAGLGLLVGAGIFVVKGALGIGEAFALDPFVVGVTMVSVGTSVPELATTLIARVRGHEEVALGTVLGSNLFNGLFIAPAAALLTPATVAWSSVAASLGTGALLVLLIAPRKGGLARWRGLPLLVTYAGFIAWVLMSRPG
ncbi:MAG: calcium/sodium antiporter [Myxococcaceae bacterium]|nr:calcium/sodium antiporter [Myxococcaceae bacterium]